MLGERLPGDPPLPDELAAAVREWAAFVEAERPGGPDEQQLVRRRGHQLAIRVADRLGRPVEFVDPVTRMVTSVRAQETKQPVPWVTGLPVAAFFAVLTAMADVALSRALIGSFGLLWVPANLLAGIGLAPSLWLVRRTPFWRWPALGTAVGLAVAWLLLLVGLLGHR